MNSNNFPSIYPNPDNFGQNINQSSQEPSKKHGWWKILAIILVIISLAALIYFVFHQFKNTSVTKEPSSTGSPSSNLSTLTITGERENLAVTVPAGYQTASKEDSTAIIYNPDYVKKEEIEKAAAFRGFTFMFMRNNDTNSVSLGAKKIKSLLEKIKEKLTPQSQITSTTINNIFVWKNEGRGVGETSNFYFSEYYFITDKSVFLVGRANYVNEPNFAQKEFDEILNSIQISPK
jgi:flagellar basal body-associated protein FliL